MSYRIRILSLKTNSSFMRRRDGDGVALFGRSTAFFRFLTSRYSVWCLSRVSCNVSSQLK